MISSGWDRFLSMPYFLWKMCVRYRFTTGPISGKEVRARIDKCRDARERKWVAMNASGGRHDTRSDGRRGAN